MSTKNETIDLVHATFENIDRHVKAFERTVLGPDGVADEGDDKFDRMDTAFAAVRPILVGLAAIPLIPPAWRLVMRIHILTMDDAIATFKAGKDLAVGDTTVEMEPKLPVG
jgi:hypothetical protein